MSAHIDVTTIIQRTTVALTQLHQPFQTAADILQDLHSIYLVHTHQVDPHIHQPFPPLFFFPSTSQRHPPIHSLTYFFLRYTSSTFFSSPSTSEALLPPPKHPRLHPHHSHDAAVLATLPSTPSPNTTSWDANVLHGHQLFRTIQPTQWSRKARIAGLPIFDVYPWVRHSRLYRPHLEPW